MLTSQHDKWWKSRKDESIALHAWLVTQKTWCLNRKKNIKSKNAKNSQWLKVYKKSFQHRVNSSYKYLYDKTILSVNSTIQHQKVIKNSEIILDKQKDLQIQHNSHSETKLQH